MTQLLRDVLPTEALGYQDERFINYLDVEVVQEIESFKHPWVGNHKNVHFWWVLANGMAVAWNESPSRGWAFPVASKQQVKKGRK